MARHILRVISTVSGMCQGDNKWIHLCILSRGSVVHLYSIGRINNVKKSSNTIMVPRRCRPEQKGASSPDVSA